MAVSSKCWPAHEELIHKFERQAALTLTILKQNAEAVLILQSIINVLLNALSCTQKYLVIADIKW